MLTTSSPFISQFLPKITCLSEANEDGFGERALWAAVITQALMDGATQSLKPEAIKAKEEALEWLKGESESFKEMCEMAGYDPDYVRSMSQHALARQCRWRNAPRPGRASTSTPAEIRARISGAKRRQERAPRPSSRSSKTATPLT